MQKEFRVQFETEDGKHLFTIFRTDNLVRANEYRNALSELNERFATDHTIASREYQKNQWDGSWSQIS